ncbi:DUF6396 domain-containing protein [Pseudomonas sp. FP2335]|uniref:SEL1-like repeat protein n=1 Tax=Pseudomonas sp. FP2335 TaxID=2954092 RepID=UPI002732DE6A|nr:DUF6396 domain-containing protein [Pseudomonas sp. FP2335]WLH76970.1 DUF6396 domain-containing protein [Pseudomonas sp. FP2335]
MRILIWLTSLLLVACDSGLAPTRPAQSVSMNPLTEIKAKLAFTCVHEQISAPTAQVDELFQYARWLQKNNLLKQDEAVDAEIERLYRIAAENGHYKANINLQNGSMRGHFKLRSDEHLRLSQTLIDGGVATGYYFIGIFLKNGSTGLKQDSEMALRYFRKAADQGSAEAQYSVAQRLAPSDVAPDIARQMRRCAAEQGHREAASDLGVNLKGKGLFQEALEVFQLGVAAGDETSAGWLRRTFRGPPLTDTLYYLNQEKDLERSERYEKIWRTLANYSYANPKVPEINEILPLPPAKLPAWDGKLQWLEAHLANIPPPKPSEALITQLANAKLLDPATGQGLPGSPAFSQSHLSAPNGYSGQICPLSGYWEVGLLSWGDSLRDGNGARYFKQGDVFPTVWIERYQSRLWPFSDKVTQREQAVEWCLLS